MHSLRELVEEKGKKITVRAKRKATKEKRKTRPVSTGTPLPPTVRVLDNGNNPGDFSSLENESDPRGQNSGDVAEEVLSQPAITGSYVPK